MIVEYALNVLGGGRVGPSWSASVNQRPAAGGTPNVSSTPLLTPIARTCSGSPSPVTVPLVAVHTPSDWNARLFSAYVRYMEGERRSSSAEPAPAAPGAICRSATSSS